MCTEVPAKSRSFHKYPVIFKTSEKLQRHLENIENYS